MDRLTRRIVDSAGHVRLPVVGLWCAPCRYWTPLRDADPEEPACFVCGGVDVARQTRWEREDG